MSVEQAMLLRAQPQALARKFAALVEREVLKGCTGHIAPVPVRLEPSFQSLFGGDVSQDEQPGVLIPSSTGVRQPPTYLRIWISPEQRFDWNRSELWLKQLAQTTDRIAFQIAGNSARLEMGVLCCPDDAMLVVTAFQGQFGHCEIKADNSRTLEDLAPDLWTSVQFRDFYPPPPYSHNLTCFEELHSSPFEALLAAMRVVPPPAVAFFQCVFQPVHCSHNWHQNVSLLLDMEYVVKLHNSPATSFRALQQTPSGDLRQMAKDVEVKAHNDKPFFAAAVRVGVVGLTVANDAVMRSLASALGVMQHGGRPLQYVAQTEYLRCMDKDTVRRMFLHALVHRPGFLLNSKELAGLAHIFPSTILDARSVPLETLPSLPFRSETVEGGTRIGTCRYAGEDHDVCIPPAIRECSVHVISSPGMGKTTVLINMLLQDIPSMGTVFFDAHGDATRDLLRLIPSRFRSRCIYFDPGDHEWIPLWNPLQIPPGGDVYRLADDLVSVFARVFKDWGDRLEHVIRNGLIGLGALPNVCMADLYTLLRQKADDSDAIRRQIVATTADEPVRKFWQEDFVRDYSKSDLQAPKHKLSKLVSAGPVSAMLSQPESLINFRKIMDEGGIMLVNLSTVGAKVREILGSFMLSLFLMAAISRSDTQKAQRKAFSMYVDEAHLFVSADAIENIITQARKFHVSICLAHQYLKQFQTAQIDAVSSVGCTLMGRLDRRDSQFFSKDLQELVEPIDIAALEPYEMLARIGTRIVKVRTLDPPGDGDAAQAAEIIQESRRRYCRPAAEVRQLIRHRAMSRNQPFARPNADLAAQGFSDEDLRYEEL